MKLKIDPAYGPALQELNGLLKRTENVRPALTLLEGVAKEAFATQYSTGKGWGALKKSTIAEKGNNRKLVDRGDLRDAFVKHPTTVYGAASVTVGVTIARHPEVKYLKSGARGMKRRNPAKVDTKWVKQRGAEVLLAHFLSGGFRSGA